jgi:hypothetical protein
VERAGTEDIASPSPKTTAILNAPTSTNPSGD